MLSELFTTISKAKVIESKRTNLIAKVDELAENQLTDEDLDDKLAELETNTEKKLSNVINKLQNDIALMKRQMASIPSSSSGYGGGGSGEVRILRMDDIDLSGLTDSGYMSYNASTNKIEFTRILDTIYDQVFSNIINKPTTINEDMSYTVLSYLKIKDTLHIKGNLGIR